MRHRNTYKTLAPFFAFVLFFSTSGIAVNLHYCKGMLKSWQLLVAKETCHTDEVQEYERNCCNNTSSCLLKSPKCDWQAGSEDCCTNKASVVKLEVDLPLVNNDKSSAEQLDDSSMVISFEKSNVKHVQADQYTLPAYTQPSYNLDRTIIYQVFIC